MKRLLRVLILASFLPLLGATAKKAEEKRPAPPPPKPVITNSPALDSLEEMVWANRDKLSRWCLKCMGFEGYKRRVEYLRSRLGGSGVNSEIWKARMELLDEIRENMLSSYIADVEGRTTEATVYKKIHQAGMGGGDIELEFRVTEKDELGDTASVHYSIRVVRYDPANLVWKTVSIEKRERSSLRKEEDDLRQQVREAVARKEGKEAR